MGKLKDKKAYFHWSKPALFDEACSLNDRVVNLEKELEQAKQQIAELEAKLALAHKDVAFYRHCAFSGEIPGPSAAPSYRHLKETSDD